MKKRLSNALKAAIKAYLTNRDNQDHSLWNKERDCENITKASFADGFIRCEQCCGTWWFSVRRGQNVWVFECHEETYTKVLTGIKRNVVSNALTDLLGAA